MYRILLLLHLSNYSIILSMQLWPSIIVIKESVIERRQQYIHAAKTKPHQ